MTGSSETHQRTIPRLTPSLFNPQRNSRLGRYMLRRRPLAIACPKLLQRNLSRAVEAIGATSSWWHRPELKTVLVFTPAPTRSRTATGRPTHPFGPCRHAAYSPGWVTLEDLWRRC